MSITTIHRGQLTKTAAPLILILLSFSVSTYYFYPQILNASLWLIDDHQIWNFLDQIQLRGDNYLQALFDTLRYNLDAGVRARPVYRVLRLAEIYMWRDWTVGWYAFRAFLFACVGGFVSMGVLRLAGFSAAVASIAAVAMLPQIGGSFTRLGAAESYGLVGMSIAFFALGHIATAVPDWRRTKPWMLTVLSLGLTISVGSKENLLPLLGLAVIPFFLLLAGSARSWLSLSSFLLLLASVAPVVYLVAETLVSGRAAYFAADVSSSSVLSRILSANSQLFPLTALPVALTAVGLALWGTNRRIWHAVLLGWLSLTLYATVVLQPVFYPQGWPVEPPSHIYNAVGYFAALLMTTFVAADLIRWLGAFVGEGVSAVRVVKGAVVVGAVVALMVIGTSLKAVVDDNVLRTGRTRDTLAAVLEQILQQNPTFLVVEATSAFGSYEPTFSLLSWIRHRNLETPAFLRLSIGDDEEGSKGAELAESLRKISEEGQWGFTPYSHKPVGGNCISIFFQSAEHVTECRPVIVQY